MISLTENQLKKIIDNKLSYNSMVDFQNASDYELRIALNETIKDIISYEETKTDTKEKREYIVTFEIVCENLYLDYIEKLGLKDMLKNILKDRYDKVVNMENNLRLGQGIIGRFSMDKFEEISNKGKFCKLYSLFYKNAQFKQQIIDSHQIETFFDEELMNVVFKRLNKYKVKIGKEVVFSQIYDIPYLSENTNYIRVFEPEVTAKIEYNNFIKGKFDDFFAEKNKINSICDFLYVPKVNEFARKLYYMQQKFLADSIIEDIFDDEMRIYNNVNNIEEHININLIETNVAIVSIKFIKKLISMGFDFRRAISKAKKVFCYYNVNVHKESFDFLDLDYVYEIENDIKFVVDKVNKTAIDDGYKEIIDGNQLNSFNLIAFIAEKIIVGSESHKKYLVKNNYINITENFVKKINVKKYEFNDFLFSNDFVLENIYQKKLDYKKNILDKYKLTDINTKSIFNMMLSNFHEGKRQLMYIFYCLYVYLKLKENVNYKYVDSTFFMSGISSFDYLICKKAITFYNKLANKINWDKYIQEKIKLIFLENIMIDDVVELAKACDVYNYIPFENFDVSNTYPYAFMYNGSILLTSKSNIFHSFEHKIDDIGIFKFDENNSNIGLDFRQLSSVKFIIDNLFRLNDVELMNDFYEIYHLIIKYNDSFNVLKSLDNYIEVNENIQYAYLDKKLWDKLALNNIEVSKGFGINQKNRRD